MAILSAVPVIQCQSIEDTLVFYQQLLQFVIVKKREVGGELAWVHLMHGDTTLMLQAAEQQSSESLLAQNKKISLYFFINNIKEQHHLIKAKSYPVSAIETRNYQMREFSLSDPDGNIIIVGQKD